MLLNTICRLGGGHQKQRVGARQRRAHLLSRRVAGSLANLSVGNLRRPNAIPNHQTQPGIRLGQTVGQTPTDCPARPADCEQRSVE